MGTNRILGDCEAEARGARSAHGHGALEAKRRPLAGDELERAVEREPGHVRVADKPEAGTARGQPAAVEPGDAHAPARADECEERRRLHLTDDLPDLRKGGRPAEARRAGGNPK